MNKKYKFLTGFTLIELMVVVVIIGVLASLTIPLFSKIVEKSRQAEAINVLTKAYEGYKALLIDEGVITIWDSSTWGKLGFNEDPNTNSKYFDYYFYFGPSAFAMRKGYDSQDNRWIYIFLENGTIIKGDHYK